MSRMLSFPAPITAPYHVVESLNRIILRQQTELDAIRAENTRLEAHAGDDHSVRQFARSQLEEYRGFLCGVLSDEDATREVQRLGEFEDDDDSSDDESDDDDFDDYSEEEAEMSE
jgi:hypothetical protein